MPLTARARRALYLYLCATQPVGPCAQACLALAGRSRLPLPPLGLVVPPRLNGSGDVGGDK